MFCIYFYKYKISILINYNTMKIINITRNTFYYVKLFYLIFNYELIF